jgi:hypothetical protein
MLKSELASLKHRRLMNATASSTSSRRRVPVIAGQFESRVSRERSVQIIATLGCAQCTRPRRAAQQGSQPTPLVFGRESRIAS